MYMCMYIYIYIYIYLKKNVPLHGHIAIELACENKIPRLGSYHIANVRAECLK